MIFLKTITIFFSALCLANTLTGQPISVESRQTRPAFTKEVLTKLIASYQQDQRFNGVVIVSHRNQIVFQRAYGKADLQFDQPNTIETRFRIASITKPFTALAILKLVELGKIRLDDPISSYIDGFDKRLTVRHLLVHRSGLPRSVEELSTKTTENYFSLAEIVLLAKAAVLASDPGTTFAYSNLGYSVLAAIIEKVTHKSFSDSLNELVLVPLRMTSTFNEPNATVIRNRANGYVLLPDGVYNAGYENKSHAIGAGSLTSSAVDLIRFLDSIEKSDGFSQETKALFLKPIVTNRTLGLITWEYRSFDEKHLPSKGRVVMHAGSCPGFETVFGRFIDHEISIVILSNQSPLSVNSLFNEIGNLMLGFVPKPAEPMKFSFYQQVLAHGAADFLPSARAASSDSIPSSSEINRMGYNYLGTGAFDKAIEIFKVNTLLNPSVGNTFDSLGHAYFMKSQLDLAIASYQIAIKADPSNQGSKAALNKISALQQRRKD